jgi:alkaline phosphatase
VILEKTASLVSPGLAVEVQSTDTLITDASGSASSLAAKNVIQLFCDGSGRWYVTYYQ